MQIDNTAIIAAAILARTNMGQSLPEAGDLKFLVTHKHLTLSSAVYDVCQNFMENEEHEEIFLGEAESWAKTLKEYGLVKAAQIWPDAFLVIAEAEGVDLTQLGEGAYA